jgi:hypothetical protein
MPRAPKDENLWPIRLAFIHPEISRLNSIWNCRYYIVNVTAKESSNKDSERKYWQGFITERVQLADGNKNGRIIL